MRYEAFFKEHHLFHHEELVAHLKSSGSYNENTLKAALQYHFSKKHLARIRRGYYLVTNNYLTGIHVENDQQLIASHFAIDAVISYHTAMEYHALAYSVHPTVYFNSSERIGVYKSVYGDFQQIAHPKALMPNDIFSETKIHDRLGMDMRVTSIERTLVDALHRPELCGGWEEIWRSFESIRYLDVERLIQYALRLGNGTTIAKLGFFLEQHKEQFLVKESQLDVLMTYRPKSRHYMQKNASEEVKNLKRWNLIVPLSVYNKIWEEPYNDDI
ncbi:MAG: hypothetical protein P1U63_12670 [Coxiellaceae bacterium]|nr:hypothetical protein [Coxiellaceae bacterium]